MRLITIRVPKETVKMQYIVENQESGFDTVKTVQMGDIVCVQEEQPKITMDKNAIMSLRTINDEKDPVRDK